VKYLATLGRLTLRDWRLFVQAFVTLAICQTRLRRQNFETLRAWATSEGQGSESVNKLIWSVEAAAKRMKNGTCLCKALALQRLLARNGHHSELRIGVDKCGGQFTAHAWLVHNGRVLTGGTEIGSYKLLAAWVTRHDGARGQFEGTSDR
jgi:Transglutaminase-like superfamily